MASDWVQAIRAGDFARAWAINDRDSLEVTHPPKHTGPRHLQRIWRGEDLKNKHVLVRCYHGLGDTIQFLRFIRPLRQIARSVTLWCQPELLPLVESAPGIDRAFPLHDGVPEVDFEVDIEIMEVPHAIRARRDQVEVGASYLALPPAVVPPLREEQNLAVGLVWKVGEWDKRREVPAALLSGLAVPGVTLYSVQRGASPEELAAIGALEISTPDIATLGHRLRQLDLLVCVDTMVAHLAGALGCETWVLLHAECDWRWPQSGAHSFWYPSLRLFHQKKPGDWGTVTSEVRCALRSRLEVGQARVAR